MIPRPGPPGLKMVGEKTRHRGVFGTPNRGVFDPFCYSIGHKRGSFGVYPGSTLVCAGERHQIHPPQTPIWPTHGWLSTRSILRMWGVIVVASLDLDPLPDPPREGEPINGSDLGGSSDLNQTQCFTVLIGFHPLYSTQSSPSQTASDGGTLLGVISKDNWS